MEILRNKGLAWFFEDGYQSIVAWIHLFSSRNTPESFWFQQTDYPFQIAGILKQKGVWDENSKSKDNFPWY